jgi:hypothetical protein
VRHQRCAQATAATPPPPLLRRGRRDCFVAHAGAEAKRRSKTQPVEGIIANNDDNDHNDDDTGDDGNDDNDDNDDDDGGGSDGDYAPAGSAPARRLSPGRNARAKSGCAPQRQALWGPVACKTTQPRDTPHTHGHRVKNQQRKNQRETEKPPVQWRQYDSRGMI